ncbi:MAG: hypothetical protein KDK38_04815 [Leptospiraceae bacterium]|nr:hypothetical protein [Leptospiraceae bacterium]
MYKNDSYQSEVEAILKKAKELEQSWCSLNPEVNARQIELYTSPVRPPQPLWGYSPQEVEEIPTYPPCPRCGNSDFIKERVLDSVRHNGDGNGTFYDTCSRCGWTIYWHYDESL